MVVRTDTPVARAAIVAEAARILLDGGVVMLPTDTVYGLAAHPGHPGAVERIYALKGRAEEKPLALLASREEALATLGGVLSPAARRLAQRFWPGALTIVADCAGRAEGVRIPDHALARAVIEACGGLLRVTSANLSGAPPALTAADALRDVGAGADLVIDGGAAGGGTASTVVRDAPGGLSILRAGAIPAAAIEAAASGSAAAAPSASRPADPGVPLLLFVCSGNTCRSPMAEALMCARLAPSGRWRVGSAGTQAVEGLPASLLAQQALAELGLSAAGHRSRPVTPELVREAGLVAAMGRQHFERIIACSPAARDKVFLLGRFAPRGEGLDIDDPAGGALECYRQCRDAISVCLPGLVSFLNVLA